jgi:hypothetical protein
MIWELGMFQDLAPDTPHFTSQGRAADTPLSSQKSSLIVLMPSNLQKRIILTGPGN